MERIGDQASDIAEILISADASQSSPIPYLTDMAAATSKMVNKKCTGFCGERFGTHKKSYFGR